MGGPWRERGFDPTAWRTPATPVESTREAGASGLYDRVTVIAYIAAVITSVAVMLVILKTGW